ncbi:MAG TPA: type IV pilus biogenesis/stability protein PilW [Steroidobacteraceae bacterium]|nr:type IV pilus biogenesis/stability protein PilW [Steroidobacteraceae bacterium]
MKIYAALSVVLLAGCQTTSTPAPSPKRQADAASYNTQLGIAYMQEGNLQLAKEKLERAEHEDGDNPQVHMALGMLYQRLGNNATADNEFRHALRLAPEDPEISNVYAVFLCDTKRVDEGVKRFYAAARDRLYRTPEAAYTNAGVCLHSVHRDDEAIRSFQQAITIRPSFAEATYQLADLELQRGHASEARALIDRFLGSNPATADLLLVGARSARALGDRLGEERYARKLRVDFPDSPQSRALKSSAPGPG